MSITICTTICITTCGRPDGLARLLESLTRLHEQTPPFDVLVVDNHPDRHGRAVCNEFAGKLTVGYVVEEQRGIPFARNRAIESSPPNSEFLVFIDDDETADPDWLRELRAVQVRTKADVVTGPALPEYPENTPSWIIASGAFDQLRFGTDADRPFAYTNNVLVRRDVYDKVQPNFDERLVHTGGSDTHFFMRVKRAGFRIVWADDAITYEHNPPSRVSAGWLIRRSFRIGGTDAFLARDLETAPLVRVMIGSARYLVRGLLRTLSGLWGGRAALLNGARDCAHAAGLIVGLFGYRYGEYKVRP